MPKTQNQLRRQKTRDRGRYSSYPKCELCGKTVSGGYYSDVRCNRTGVGVVLHKNCAKKVQALSDKEYISRLTGRRKEK